MRTPLLLVCCFSLTVSAAFAQSNEETLLGLLRSGKRPESIDVHPPGVRFLWWYQRSIASARSRMPAQQAHAMTAKECAKFLSGVVTLAQVEGRNRDHLYVVAEIAHKALKDGRLDDATDMFEGLVCYNPLDAYFHEALGACYQKAKRGHEAIAQYDMAIQINASISSYCNRGETNLLMGRTDAGISDLENAVAMDAGSGDQWAARARLLLSAIKRRKLQAAWPAEFSEAEPPPLIPELGLKSPYALPPKLEGSVRLAVSEHRNNSTSPSSLDSDKREVFFRIDDKRVSLYLTYPGWQHGEHIEGFYTSITGVGQEFSMRLYKEVPVKCRVEAFERVGGGTKLVISYSGLDEYESTYNIRFRFSGALVLLCSANASGWSVTVKDRHGYGLDEGALPLITRAYVDSDGRMPIGEFLKSGELTAWEGRWRQQSPDRR